MITIYHNPKCGTSRNVLTLIEASGEEHSIVPYLERGWTREQLSSLFKAANLTPRQALRETKSPAKEMGLLEEGLPDETLIAAMLEHPVLVNRPIVVSPKGVKLCRPSETVIPLLTNPLKGPVYKEDGEMLVDEQGSIVS